MSRSIDARLLADIDQLTSAQSGFILASQLVATGASRSTIASLTRTGGRLQRVLPATCFVERRPLTGRERERAALLYAGTPALLTGSAVVRAYGLRYAPGDAASELVHVLIEHQRTRASRGFVRVERTLRFPQAVLLGDRPVAPMARALFDAARHTTDRRETRAMVLEALQGNGVTAGQLEAEIASGQRRWTALLRDAVREYRAGSASAPEAEFKAAWEARGLGGMLWNPTLTTPGGRFIGVVDAYDEEVGLGVEMDSREFHSGARWAATIERQRRLATYGIVVVSIIPSQLRAEEERVIQDVLRTRQSLRGRPRPQIVATPFSTE